MLCFPPFDSVGEITQGHFSGCDYIISRYLTIVFILNLKWQAVLTLAVFELLLLLFFLNLSEAVNWMLVLIAVVKQDENDPTVRERFMGLF